MMFPIILLANIIIYPAAASEDVLGISFLSHKTSWFGHSEVNYGCMKRRVKIAIAMATTIEQAANEAALPVEDEVI